MKKLFSLFLVLAASIGTMFAEKVKIGDLYYNLDDGNKTAEVIGTDEEGKVYKYSGDIVIPASVEYNSVTYSVTSIGNYAFNCCSGLTSVKIPNSVTSIGEWAFSNCTGLTLVTIGNSVTSIGEWAFYACTGLTSVTIGNSVTSIGNYAFNCCSGLTSVKIPNSVTSIGEWAFSNCTGLTLVTIGNSVTSIGEWAFYACTGLTSVTIGNSVTSIGAGAFNGCTGLTSVTIPNSVTSIGISAFFYCTGLTSITIPNSVTSIGDRAFAWCDELTSITIPNSVTSIGREVFYGCEGLTSVTCMATIPPSMILSDFYGVDCSQIPLYVPVGSIDAYRTAYPWEYFTNILPITAKETETNTVKTEPTTNSVEVTWPVVAGAYTYEIVIKDKSGNVVCTLVFNAQGQLQSIAFNAPGRDGAPQQTQGAGFTYTITGLTAGISYDVTITAKDSNGATLDTQTVSFTTDGTQGIDDINAATKSQKIVRDNQVLILRGEKTYTVTGQEVK